MCFYHDYDWYADVSEESHIQLTEPQVCYECGAKLEPGSWAKHLWQQQSEICVQCDEDGNDSCGCDAPDYGETHESYTCVTCLKFLVGIYEYEIANNCPEHSAQPSVGGLYEEIGWADESHDYALKAIEIFPELASTRVASYLDEEAAA